MNRTLLGLNVESVFFRSDKILRKLFKTTKSAAVIFLPLFEFEFVFVEVAMLLPPEGEEYLVGPIFTFGLSL